MATTNAHEELLDRIWEQAWNNGNLDVLDDAVTDDYVMHAPSAPAGIHGAAEAKEFMATYREAFPDLSIRIEDRLVDGDAVAERYTVRGTHEGEFMGIAPTGVETEHTGIVLHYFEDGKVNRQVVEFDALDLLRQLGAVEAPPQ